MDELVASRGAHWPRREEFILKNFERHLRADVDPATAAFIDGAVLNNRPFREAIAAIHGRSAYRDVDRRLVFIDANPASVGPALHADLPNFFSTIKGALSDLPSAQPIANELTWVIDLNAQVRGIKSIIESARPHVSELVGDIIDKPLDRPFSTDDIARLARTGQCPRRARGRLRARGLCAAETHLGSRLRRPHDRRCCGGAPPNSPQARVVEEIIDAWAASRGRLQHDRAARHSSMRLRPRRGFPPGSNFFLPSTSNIAGAGCIS